MRKIFTILEHLNVPNVITSMAVILSVFCLYHTINNNIKLALTLYLFVLVLNRLDGVAARKLSQISEFGKELGELAEVSNFIIPPIIISYFMGFSSWYSTILFSLFVVTGIWRLADFSITGMVKVNKKFYFKGLCCTHSAAIFLILTAIYSKFFIFPISHILVPFFIISSLLMISSFIYNKNGIFTISLYIISPLAIILLWI
ncbi:MAG: CDP-alcohol phosphatidyltransferase family protein [Oligoflexia bacterium]|nr:CDP-alcohol phosphatidyltransferase family protein [Oligoflexia bacterium]